MNGFFIMLSGPVGAVIGVVIHQYLRERSFQRRIALGMSKSGRAALARSQTGEV